MYLLIALILNLGLLAGFGRIVARLFFVAPLHEDGHWTLPELLIAGITCNGVVLVWVVGLGMPVRSASIVLIMAGLWGLTLLSSGSVARHWVNGLRSSEAKLGAVLSAAAVVLYLSVHVSGREAGVPFDLGVDQFGFSGFAISLFGGDGTAWGWQTPVDRDVLSSMIDFRRFTVDLFGGYAARWVASAQLAQLASIVGADHPALVLGSVAATWVAAMAAALWYGTAALPGFAGQRRWLRGAVQVTTMSPLLIYQYVGLGNWGALASMGPLVTVVLCLATCSFGRTRPSRLTAVGLAAVGLCLSFTYLESLAIVCMASGVVVLLRCHETRLFRSNWSPGSVFGRLRRSRWMREIGIVASLYLILVLPTGSALWNALVSKIGDASSGGWPQPSWVSLSDIAGVTDMFLTNRSYEVASLQWMSYISAGGGTIIMILVISSARLERAQVVIVVTCAASLGLVALGTLVSGNHNYLWSRVSTLLTGLVAVAVWNGVAFIASSRITATVSFCLIVIIIANGVRIGHNQARDGVVAGRSTWAPAGCAACAELSSFVWVTDPRLGIRGFQPVLTFEYKWLNGPNVLGKNSKWELAKYRKYRLGIMIKQANSAGPASQPILFEFRTIARDKLAAFQDTGFTVEAFMDSEDSFDFGTAERILFAQK